MNASDPVLVRARGVHFAHGPRVIYDGVDIDIPRGKVVAIMGPSGTGKTTLLRLIGGQWRPNQGTVEFDGVDVHTLRRGALYELRKRMGMLFQNGALLTDLTVFENVAFPMREQTRLPESMIRDLVLMKLQAVGLRGARDLYPQQLSGGMSRRVALARAIALDPDLVMYDEPFAGQDPISMGVLMRLIRTLNDALGLTSIVVSHDLQEVLSIADYGYMVADGKVQVQGTPDAIRQSDHPWVKQFLKGEPDGPVAFHYKAPAFATDLLGDAR
ncbi:MAG: ATP-binding cassette protein [Panacagrimonas sp.]|jgi:phospholipid/cholesterol/gamma-HCH transport system ATP-binding protein|nr:ABC transporter ATP-binding protein [Panacagrimonas sp.]MCC2655244.1 ATP-binding cassette protein [Panacagrimonas sp.]